MDVFVARQPIFDRDQRAIAYELLFRSATGGPVHADDYEQAALNVLRDIFFVFGLENLTAGKKAFVNLSRRALLEEKVTIFPPQTTIVEILEDIEPDEEVIDACRRLKAAGYKLALDDFVYRESLDPLVELADYIKVDFKLTVGEERRAIINRYANRPIQFVAEKVETHEEFHEAYECGYAFFQGFFICEPEIVSSRDIPGFKVNYLRLLKEINGPGLDMDKLEEIIKHDVSLSYKLLRYLNSAWFGWRTEVKTIKAALVRLGERPIRKWVSMLAFTNLAEDKPPEVLLASLIRARFCELVGRDAGFESQELDLFLMGMFSLIDALIDRPLGEILDELSLSHEVKCALLDEGNGLGTIYHLVLAYERGSWEKVVGLAQQLGVESTRLPEYYTESVEWAEQVLRL